MGAIHVVCSRSEISETGKDALRVTECQTRSVVFDNVAKQMVVRQTIHRKLGNVTKAEYRLHETGVVRDIPCIVDTTGAGDAFIGGFILAQLVKCSDVSNTTQFGLEFGAWVAAKKLEGPGARSALPVASDVDEQLGKKASTVRETLSKILFPFGDH